MPVVQQEVRMSTVAPGRPAAGSGGGYEVARPQGQCVVCQAALGPGQQFMAALQETPSGFARLDCCRACWDPARHSGLVAFWQTTMPAAEARRKMFVDDGVLCDLFERLAAVEEPAKVNFRFVLGLILMRKKLLTYESTGQRDGREVWVVRVKGRAEPLEMVNPHLGEEQVREVSGQLGEILNQEM
jgi:hypothetical protein